MPTYLTHEKAPVYSSNSDFWDLDPNNTLGLSKKSNGAHDAPNGETHHIVIGKHNLANSHDRFDESSASSTHASDLSDSLPTQMNGTRPTSMNSLQNGKAVTGRVAPSPEAVGREIEGSRSWDETDCFDHETEQTTQTPQPHNDQPILNGYVKMPDRAAPPPPPPAVNGSTKTVNNLSLRQQNDQHPPRTSVGSATASSLQQSLADNSPKAGRSSDAGSFMDGSATMPSRSDWAPGPATPGPATSSASLAADQKDPGSTHRYSSPPLYHTTSATASGSNSLQVPPDTGVKQRHTLEIPKIQPPRVSKDGGDSAFASGRFSPTTTTAGVRRASLSLARRNTRSIQSDAPRDEVFPDEDALRWAEAYRQKRASKRKKREEEDDDRVLVGTKVDEHHANWVTAYNMLTGIRVSVSRTNAKLDRPLTDADFGAKQKSTFDIAGNELVPSAKYDFKFKDYAPWVFRHLRALFRLDPADYLMSLTGKYMLSELGSPGKSGSFFYFSRDYKYIIKTIHHAEHKFLRKILKDYYQHVTDNPNTLLSQFYGLHRVKMPYGKKIHFVVMNNLFPPHRDIHSTFDLKGSTIGRDYKEDNLGNNPRATMKDLNWLRRQRSLEFGLKKKRLFLEQLNRDVVLLKKLQIMDYSLLVGIHDLQRGNEENLRGKTLQVFNPGGDNTGDDSEPQSVLLRTPSKLESARKAKELRQMIRQERPVPVGQTAAKMPDELDEAQNRTGFVFNQDDGGLRATHEDNSPADEIYYLGVIDCLTHYGMVKKIEHFWKGLTNDRSQISALPPDQYGDRFYHFIEGITLSPEEAQREKQRKEQEEVEAAAETSNERVPSWRSSTSRRKSAVPPMPTHLPPPVPMPSGQLSPKAKETMEKATHEARKTEEHGASEESVPDKVITTVPGSDKRESGQPQPILPVVEETAEVYSTGGRSRDGDEDYRPVTPAKRSQQRERLSGHNDQAPPTPPKNLKPESQDSGYGAMAQGKGNGTTISRDSTLRVVQRRLSKDSLNKDLPPLPTEAGSEGNIRTSFA